MSRSLDGFLRQASKLAPYETLEELFTSPDGFRIRTPSALQLAICRAMDGRSLGDTWDDPDVREAFAGVHPSSDADEFVILTGVRSGKSLLAAACSVHMTQHCLFESAPGISLGLGEMPRIPVQSVHMKNAQAVFGHICGNVLASSFLKGLVIDKPTADAIVLRHPTGRPIKIEVSAGSRAGANLVSFWLAGAVFDEAARMMGQDDGIINLEDSRSAVRFRILRGGKILYITSPWEPRGPIYEWKQTRYGKPGPMVVVYAPSNVMCPALWSPERVAKAYEDNPDEAAVDLGAQFKNPEINLFPIKLLEKCTREDPITLPWREDCDYVAAMDPATRGNAWTLVVVTRTEGKIRVAYARDWQGTRDNPLSPTAVLKEIRDILADYRLDVVITDQWAADALYELAQPLGLGILREDFRAKERIDLYLSFARRLEAGIVELAPVPDCIRDLAQVKRRSTSDGVAVVLPKPRESSRHADYAPALVVAASRYLSETLKAQKPNEPEMDPDEEAEALEPWRDDDDEWGDAADWEGF